MALQFLLAVIGSLGRGVILSRQYQLVIKKYNLGDKKEQLYKIEYMVQSALENYHVTFGQSSLSLER